MKNPKANAIAWGVAGALTFALSAMSCKPTNEGSDAKSLDNFVKADGEAQTLNHCGYAYDGKPLKGALKKRAELVVAPTLELKNAAIGVLMAVPEQLALPFFAAGGKILITSDAATRCASALSRAERNFAGKAAEAVRACWRQPALGAAPEIVIEATEADVHHGLLRMFAYVFNDLFVYRAGLVGDPTFNTPTWRQALDGYKEARDALATTFLDELDRPAQRDAAARLEKFKEEAGDKFAGFVAAEAVDSYYCSAASRKSFKQQFPKTYAAFTDVRDEHSMLRQFGAVPSAP